MLPVYRVKNFILLHRLSCFYLILDSLSFCEYTVRISTDENREHYGELQVL